MKGRCGVPDQTPETIRFQPDPEHDERVARYVATLPDVSGEFSGFYEVPKGEDLGPLATAFALGPPTFEATITLNAPEGQPYTQAEADQMVGKSVRADMFPGQAPAVAGTIRTATATDDGSQVELVADVQPQLTADLVPIRLVPVEVFGTNECCQHGEDAEHTACPSIGYGVMDAVQGWSDCNRAIGRIYRVEDLDADDLIDPDPLGDGRYREPGNTMVIWVPRDQLAWFQRRWNTSPDVTRDHVRGQTVPVGNPE